MGPLVHENYHTARQTPLELMRYFAPAAKKDVGEFLRTGGGW